MQLRLKRLVLNGTAALNRIVKTTRELQGKVNRGLTIAIL